MTNLTNMILTIVNTKLVNGGYIAIKRLVEISHYYTIDTDNKDNDFSTIRLLLCV